jgi:hypothetical protein
MFNALSNNSGDSSVVQCLKDTKIKKIYDILFIACKQALYYLQIIEDFLLFALVDAPQILLLIR